MEFSGTCIPFPQFRRYVEEFLDIVHDSSSTLTWERTGDNRDRITGTWLRKGKVINGKPIHPINDIFLASNGQCYAYLPKPDAHQLLPKRDFVLALLDPDAGYEMQIAEAMVEWLSEKPDNRAAVDLKGRIESDLNACRTG